MTLWWSAALIAAGATVGVGLAGSALGALREERAGRVYELTPRYVRVAGRGLAAAAALLAATVGAVMAAVGGPGSGGRTSAEQPVAAVAPARSSSPQPDSDRAHASPPAAPSAALAVVGQPSGGRLYLGTLPGVPGRVRVWVPAQYTAHDTAHAAAGALQAIVVRAPQGELAEVWEGLAGAVSGGHANPFVAVAPEDPCALAADDTALRGGVAGQFRIASRQRSWVELGVDGGSSCAVAAELAHPDVYAGAAALGGALPHPATGGSGGASSLPPGIRLLLAQAHRDTAGQAEANRLRSALQGAPGAAVRLSSVVRDASSGRERFRLVRMAADYVTEEFAAVARH